MIDRNPLIDRYRNQHAPNSKVNSVFIPNDDIPEIKPMCPICRIYMVYSHKKSVYICTSCGDEYTPDMDKGDKVVNDFKSEPLIASARGKKKRNRSDFPKGAHIIEDKQIDPDGEEKELIQDNRDV